MKFQINKASEACDDFVNRLRLPGEVDICEVRDRLQRRKKFKRSGKRNVIKLNEKCLPL